MQLAHLARELGSARAGSGRGPRAAGGCSWGNRTKEWAARNRGLEVGTYDYATQYWVSFAPLPAFRHLTPEEYQDKLAELVGEIKEEGERQRNGNPVAGVEKILSQDPHEAPTRRTKRSTRPLFHVASNPARDDLRDQLADFLSQYRQASQALRLGNLDALTWFPEGCYPPAFPFLGNPPPPRPPAPPTRPIVVLDSGQVERGEIPIVTLPATPQIALNGVEPRARGQPP